MNKKIPKKRGLKKYANPSLIPFEKKAWENAVSEKHGLYF